MSRHVFSEQMQCIQLFDGFGDLEAMSLGHAFEHFKVKGLTVVCQPCVHCVFFGPCQQPFEGFALADKVGAGAGLVVPSHKIFGAMFDMSSQPNFGMFSHQEHVSGQRVATHQHFRPKLKGSRRMLVRSAYSRTALLATGWSHAAEWD